MIEAPAPKVAPSSSIAEREMEPSPSWRERLKPQSLQSTFREERVALKVLMGSFGSDKQR